MILCYNEYMKKIFLVFFWLILIFIQPVYANNFDILVLPSDILNQKENYYYFENVEEIIANDLVIRFNNSNKKTKCLTTDQIIKKLNSNEEIKKLTQKSLDQYKNTNKLDYNALNKICKYFDCDLVLIIKSFVNTEPNFYNRNIWEVLEISSAFDTSYPYKLNTSIVLIDAPNNLLIWSNNYCLKLGNNSNQFKAENYAEANEVLEKIKIYSKQIVSLSAFQNIILRLYPKSISPLKQEIHENNGDILRFDKNIPQNTDYNKPENDDFYGEMIYGI